MTTRAQYDIPLVLPGLPDVADACVERLVGRCQSDAKRSPLV